MLYNVINQVFSYWPSYGSEVCCIGLRPKLAQLRVRGLLYWPEAEGRGPI